MSVIIDERKLNLYRYMVDSGMRTLEQIPEPYRTALNDSPA